MPEVLLFGGTGHLGRHIASELHQQGRSFTAVVRHESRADLLRPLASDILVRNVLDVHDLQGICEGHSVVISALGKSVSLKDRSPESFEVVDLLTHLRILEEAKASGIRKFMYVSALHAERYPQLTYFRVHHQFSERLIASGLDYSIIKPPALYSAFLDLMELAEKGRLATLGKGDKKTNPIWEGDVARLLVATIDQPNAVLEVGGPRTFTRHEINQLIQNTAAPGKKVRSAPMWAVRALLPVIKRANRNLYDKFAFFLQVLQEDAVAPVAGTQPLPEYLRGHRTPNGSFPV